MTEIKNIPTLRFSVSNQRWEPKKFGEMYSFKSTNSFSRECLNYQSGTIKNIHYGDIHTKFNTLFDIAKERVPFINDSIKLKATIEDSFCKLVI